MTTTAGHEALLDAARRGDDAALATLVRLHHDRVYRFGLRVCRDGFDADDAVQEAFTKLATRPDVIADQGVIAWLMTVVKHTCLRLLRPFQRERRSLGERTEEEPEASEPSPETALERWQLVHSVHAAIASLELPYREVLVLRDLEGLSGEETCRALAIETATMKTRLHRARAMLRSELTRRSRNVSPSST